MTIVQGGDPDGVAVLYFHGAASRVDPGPSDELCRAAGVRLLRHIRPGYDGLPPEPDLSLTEVARAAVDEATLVCGGPLAVLGWSGGGPYALAAAASAPSMVSSTALVSAWAPMNPPDSGLPLAVRAFTLLSQRMPRPVLALVLAAVGRRTPGHVDDIRRVAADWEIEIGEIGPPVVCWHATADASVPIGPWRAADVALHEVDGTWHDPPDHVWAEVLAFATSSTA